MVRAASEHGTEEVCLGPLETFRKALQVKLEARTNILKRLHNSGHWTSLNTGISR
jgi:hypothetical protein